MANTIEIIKFADRVGFPKLVAILIFSLIAIYLANRSFKDLLDFLTSLLDGSQEIAMKLLFGSVVNIGGFVVIYYTIIVDKIWLVPMAIILVLSLWFSHKQAKQKRIY